MRRLALLLPLLLACSRAPVGTGDPVAPRADVSAPPPTSVAAPAESPEATLRARAKAVLAALAAKDGKALAALASPRGVRFSPYGYVDIKSDVVLTPAELARSMTDPTKRVWGSYDGRGDPILATFADYRARFVWTHDFTAAPQIAVDRSIGGGNTTDNLAVAYPHAHYVELHFPGFDPKLSGMDWESLRLVFESGALVGIVHAEWTI